MGDFLFCTDEGNGVTYKIDTGTFSTLASVGDGNEGVCYDGTNLYICSSNGRAVKQANPTTAAITGTTGNIGGDLWGIAAGGGFIWAIDFRVSAQGKVFKIDPASLTVAATITGIPQNGPFYAVFDFGFLWVSHNNGQIYKIDPGSNTVVANYGVGTSLYGICSDGTYLWAVDQSSNNVLKVDPSSGGVSATVGVGNFPQECCFGSGSVWVANSNDHTVSRVDPVGNTVLATITCTIHSTVGICAGGGFIWTLGIGATGGVGKIDPGSNTETAHQTIAGSSFLQDIVFVAGAAPPIVKVIRNKFNHQKRVPMNDGRGRVRRNVAVFRWPFYTQIYEQGYRVADTTLIQYQLFVGLNGHPNFSNPPAATSPTLPFTFNPASVLPSSGNGTLHLVCRLRNKYGLSSFNVFEQLLEFRSHALDLGPISPPVDLAAYDVQTGQLKLAATYIGIDDAHPADTWELYAKVGVDPVPGVDTPAYTGAMGFIGQISGITQVVGTWTAGQVLHIVATAKRTADGARGSSAVLLHTIPPSLDITDAFLFGGTAFEQQGPE